jgi:ribosomal protein S18 acetylase RimI-like enzyme
MPPQAAGRVDPAAAKLYSEACPITLVSRMATVTTTIRLAETADSDAVVKLVCGFRDDVKQVRPSDADAASSVERLLADAATDFLIALSPREGALGYVQLRYQYSVWVSGNLAQLEDLFVMAAFRRRGVGLQLLEAAAARASERSSRFIWLNTNERNLDAVRLYTRAGFSSARERWQGGRQLWLERAL